MDEGDNQEGRLWGVPGRVKYFLYPCLKCGRRLYMVVHAVNLCGRCYEENVTKVVSGDDDDDDGKDQEE